MEKVEVKIDIYGLEEARALAQEIDKKTAELVSLADEFKTAVSAITFGDDSESDEPQTDDRNSDI